MDEKFAPMDTLMMSWATPYEFWLLSTSKGKPTASIVIVQTADQLNWTLGRNNAFVTVWGVFPYKDFPKTYFKFDDIVSSYKRIDQK